MGNNALNFGNHHIPAKVFSGGRFAGKDYLVMAEIQRLFLNLTPNPVFVKTGNFCANKVCIAVKLALGLY
jgi:hypothetical protein